MSLQQLAQTVQAQGRNNDTMLVHMTPGEVAGLQALAQANGGSLSVNPETGLPEAGFLEDILPMVAGAAAMFIPGMQGVGMYLLAGGLGGMAGLATQKEGESGLGAFFRGALGGAGGAGLGSLASGLVSAGAGAAGAAGGVGGAAGAGAETLAAAAGTGVEGALATGMTQAEMLAAQTAGMGVTDAAIPLAQQAASAGSYGMEGALQQAAEPGVYDLMGEGGYNMAAENPFGPAYDSAMQETLAANELGAAEIPMSQPSGYDVLESPFDKAKHWWQTSGKQNVDKGMKVYQQANKVLGAGQRSAPQYAPMPSTPGYSPARVDMPEGGGGGGFAPRWSQGSGAGTPGASRESSMARQRRTAYEQGRWFAEGGEVNMESGGFVVPADVTAALGAGSSDAGLQALAKLGAEPIKGQGDGQSDDIRATVDGAPVARVADGEAYLPPQAVARIGGGDHEKGSRRLYKMLDNVRRQAYGHTEQMQPVDLNKALA